MPNKIEALKKDNTINILFYDTSRFNSEIK